MSGIFDNIAQAIGTALGTDQATGGLIAGFTLTVALILMFEWTIGEDRRGMTFLMSFLLSVTLCAIPIVGWIPLWVPLVMAVFTIFVLVVGRDFIGVMGR